MEKMASRRFICQYLGGNPLPFFSYFQYNADLGDTVIEKTEALVKAQEGSNDRKEGNTDGRKREKINPKEKKNA